MSREAANAKRQLAKLQQQLKDVDDLRDAAELGEKHNALTRQRNQIKEKIRQANSTLRQAQNQEKLEQRQRKQNVAPTSRA